MNRDAILNLAMAMVAIGALGVAATTFESATSTDADDVIDLDYDRLPIGQDDAATIVREMSAGDPDGSDGAAERSDPDGDEAADPGRSDADEEVAADRPRDSADDRSRPAGSSAASESSSGGSDGSSGASGLPGETPGDLSLLGRLLALLPYLLLLAALLAAGWLVHRYRDRLRALLADPDPAVEDGSATDDWLDGPPSNAVDRAWVGMVRTLDPDRPAAMTPGECAAAAVRAGFDPDAVDALTEAFREVRYGGRPVTERHERVARRTGRRLDVPIDADDRGGGSP
ncbi:DUF4129 domain-containing protein [Halorarum salinum]|uniref:DUF4129 domain-containing protein n=1 Tax=Halorarum salinum TaxID=2743089 RepID=A0A7D5QII2_9EURY|nr:DUF4129 domain-containing protein [Halobaculum salinum]QLG63603.1 DUF4129 domain-containing protein [Halobaculum salinum]